MESVCYGPDLPIRVAIHVNVVLFFHLAHQINLSQSVVLTLKPSKETRERERERERQEPRRGATEVRR